MRSLLKCLKELRKKVATAKKGATLCSISRSIIDDMATKYPITLEEMANIHGVGDGKASKYGKQFVELICSVCRR